MHRYPNGIYYCPNHNTRIVESGKARFIENGERMCDIYIQEVRMEVPIPKTSKVVVTDIIIKITHQYIVVRFYIKAYVHSLTKILNSYFLLVTSTESYN